MYEIDRVINNNIVSSINEEGKELMLRGLGIGFGKKPHDMVEDEKVEKIYRIANQSMSTKMEELLATIPEEQIDFSNEFIEYARSVIGKNLNDIILVTLADHLNFLLNRVEQGMLYRNPMLLEIKRFYPTEFAVASYGVKKIEDRYGVSLTEDEAGFIALHIVNAELDSNMGNTMQITELIQNIVDIVSDFYGNDLNQESDYYDRFITHLKFLGQRIFKNKSTKVAEDDGLSSMICKRYPKEFGCAKKIALYIKKTFLYEIKNDEKMYLTIHLRQVIMDTDK